MSTYRRPRPKCRAHILKHGYRPHPSGERFRVLCPDGSSIHISHGLRVEMARMVEEGLFANEEGRRATQSETA